MNVMNFFRDYKFKEKDALGQYHYWLDFMEKFTDIKQMCLDDYLLNKYDPKDIAVEKVFTYSKIAFEKMKEVSKTIEKICVELANKKIEMIDVSLLEINIIIYHGLGNAAGWATKYKGMPTIMLGVEKIVELAWDDQESLRNLIYHEYAHLLHEYVRETDLEPYDDHYRKWINRIYIEGFATYLESILSGTRRRNDWFKACKEKESQLKEELLHRLNHQLSCQDFFGDWYQVFGLSDTGYYLGHQYIKTLMDLYDIEYIAKMPFIQIEAALFKYLKSD
ncbi:MAG: hypothetical protein ACLFPM_01400 [Candidatus Izemoplasmatales bacterium]